MLLLFSTGLVDRKRLNNTDDEDRITTKQKCNDGFGVVDDGDFHRVFGRSRGR